MNDVEKIQKSKYGVVYVQLAFESSAYCDVCPCGFKLAKSLTYISKNVWPSTES